MVRSAHPSANDSENTVRERALQLRRKGRPHVMVRATANAARSRSEIRASPVVRERD